MNSTSLSSAYWDALGRHRRELGFIAIEDLETRQRLVGDFHVEMSRVVDRLLESASYADTEAWVAIADAYQSGIGTAKNRDQALCWFRKAAESGNVRAMVRLSSMLRHPDSPESWPEAVRWLQKAAELGDAPAMSFLGFASADGHGVVKDNERAVEWYLKAVSAGEAHAALHAGRVLARELNSPVAALRWLHYAAERGHVDSFVDLATLYDQPGTPVHNAAEAVKWYKRVEQETVGSRPRALLALAVHYRDGDGTPRDESAARECLSKVLQLTPEKSKEHRDAAKMLKLISDSPESP